MTSDLDPFRHHIAELNLTPEQQDDVLSFLWRIADSAAACAWGLDPVQSAMDQPCGQLRNNLPKAALTAPFAVKCMDQYITTHFTKAAANDAAVKESES